MNNMEPEKKDVWELFDEENEAGHFMTEHGHPNIKKLKSFIKTHFIPRAEVVEKANKIAYLSDDLGGGKAVPLDDLLDLIKTINNE